MCWVTEVSGNQYPQGALPESKWRPFTRNSPRYSYIDDILITGKKDVDHLQTLETVLEHLAKAGLWAKKNKCPFGGLPWLCDRCSRSSAPRQGVAHLTGSYAFKCDPVEIVLGSALILHEIPPKFVHSASPTLQVAGKRCPVEWLSAQEQAFKMSKELLTSSQWHVHFNPQASSAFGVWCLHLR